MEGRDLNREAKDLHPRDENASPRVGLHLESIGVIHTPYETSAPYQPVPKDEGVFCLTLDPQYLEGLQDLERFRYIYVLYYLDRLKRSPSLHVSPPWTPGKWVGIFASRSPARPNRLGLSIVEIKKIVENNVFTSGLDVFDGTPLLDIKPYIKDLDSKDDANYGWLDDLDDRQHLLLHIQGIPHDH